MPVARSHDMPWVASGIAIGSGSSRKIRTDRNRVRNSWRLLNRSAGRFWIILRTRSLNSGVTSLLWLVSGSGRSLKCFSSSSCDEFARNGGRPQANS